MVGFGAGTPDDLLEGLSSGRDSPKITESTASSMPIRSRMTSRVTRCQNDSLSCLSKLTAGFSFGSCLSVVGIRLPASLMTPSFPITSVTDPVHPFPWLRLFLLVSFSISSNRTLDCSIRHFSILSNLSLSIPKPSVSVTASSLRCKLDLLR